MISGLDGSSKAGLSSTEHAAVSEENGHILARTTSIYHGSRSCLSRALRDETDVESGQR